MRYSNSVARLKSTNLSTVVRAHNGIFANKKMQSTLGKPQKIIPMPHKSSHILPPRAKPQHGALFVRTEHIYQLKPSFLSLPRTVPGPTSPRQFTASKSNIKILLAKHKLNSTYASGFARQPLGPIENGEGESEGDNEPTSKLNM
jgi:hypothetical protein